MLAKKTLDMSSQFTTENMDFVNKKVPAANVVRPKTTRERTIPLESSNEVERDGLRIPKKIDSTWAVSKVLLQKKGKVALKDLRRLNDSSSENPRGLNRQRKVSTRPLHSIGLKLSGETRSHSLL